MVAEAAQEEIQEAGVLKHVRECGLRLDYLRGTRNI
jgi:hypothetical protein